MIPKAVVLRLVELASQAPSVHNTQPWIWRASGDQVRLYPDYSRQLPAEDPAGRNLVISCGAALDHFRYAAHALGWDTTTIRLPGAATTGTPRWLSSRSRGGSPRTLRRSTWTCCAPGARTAGASRPGRCRPRSSTPSSTPLDRGAPKPRPSSTKEPEFGSSSWQIRHTNGTWWTRSRLVSSSAGSVTVAMTACR